MRGKKLITRGLAIIMIGAGFLPVMEVAADEFPKVPSPTILKAYIGFLGDKEPKASYDVDPETGCIQNFYDKGGKSIPKTKTPAWLVEGKETLDFGNFSNSQCRQGFIGVGSCPYEHWVYLGSGDYACLWAWDYIRFKFYQPCQRSYPPCQ
jgi:hypothetical protein